MGIIIIQIQNHASTNCFIATSRVSFIETLTVLFCKKFKSSLNQKQSPVGPHTLKKLTCAYNCTYGANNLIEISNSPLYLKPLQTELKIAKSCIIKYL